MRRSDDVSALRTAIDTMDCANILEEYSDYRDGLLPASRRREFDAHLEGCRQCARYDRILRDGTSILRSLPAPRVSEDFKPRLQHSLYTIDEELRRARVGRRSGGALAGVAVVLIAVVALTWSPSSGAEPPTVQAVSALAPAPLADSREEVPLLFQNGPFLQSSVERIRMDSPALYGSGGGWLASGGTSSAAVRTAVID